MTQDEKVELAWAAFSAEMQEIARSESGGLDISVPAVVAEPLKRCLAAALEALPVEEPTTGDAVRDQLERMGSDTRYSDEFFGNFVRSRLSDILAALAQSQPTPDKDEAVI